MPWGLPGGRMLVAGIDLHISNNLRENQGLREGGY